jgi:NADH-quinone oxidoreductase subunit M
MVILGAVKANFWLGLACGHGADLRCGLHLWMFKRVYLGPVANDDVRPHRHQQRASS